MAEKAEKADSCPIVQALREDSEFRDFFRDDFDASRLANSIIESSSIAASLQKLSAGVQRLEAELQSQVSTHYQDLLTQATGIERLEDVLKMVSSRVDALRKSTERIRDKLEKPYQKLLTRNSQLSRLQSACEYLRRALRYMYLVRRLREQVKGGSREIAKAAYTLNEISSLSEDVDLTGLDVVDEEQAFVVKTRQSVEQQAGQMLEQGIETQNQALIASGLQVVRNLERLPEKIAELLVSKVDSLRASIRETIDTATLAESTDSAGRQLHILQPATRAAVWARLDKLMNIVYNASTQMRLLHRILLKKRDTGTQVRFHDLLPYGDTGVSGTHWVAATNILSEELQVLANDVPLVRLALEGEYPKLLRLCKDLWTRIAQHFMGDMDEAAAAQDLQALRQSVSSFENAYLANSYSRMFDPVNLVFPMGGQQPPSAAEVASICKNISKELELASFDPSLSLLVARNVSKIAKVFVGKCEQLQANDPSALKVARRVTESMNKNILLADRANQFCDGVREAAEGKEVTIGAEGMQYLREALKLGTDFVNGVLDPLFEALAAYLEDIVRMMHDENYAGAARGQMTFGQPDQPCSEYVTVLHENIALIETEIIARLQTSPSVQRRSQVLVERLLNSYVRNVCIIQNLGDSGMLRVAADMAQAELALAQFQSVKLANLGPSYKALRALKPLLFIEAEQIAKSPSVGQTISVSAAVHHILSRTSNNIKPPHTLKGWSVHQYETWLATHSEQETLALLQQTLEAYATQVQAAGEKQFDRVYPILLQMITAGRTALSA